MVFGDSANRSLVPTTRIAMDRGQVAPLVVRLSGAEVGVAASSGCEAALN